MIVEDEREAAARRLKRLVVWLIVALLLFVGAGLLAEYTKPLPTLSQVSDSIEAFLSEEVTRQTRHEPRPYDVPAVEASPPVPVDIDSNTINARWDLGDDVDLADYMPDKAIDANAKGESTVACRWDAGGRVTGCTIISESPQGFGFGQATLRLMRDHGRVAARNPDGTFTAGEGLKIRFRWVVD